VKREAVSFAGSAASPAQFPRDGLPEVAFLGRSNVGKSSLLNALTGVKNVARVSSTPGRTRLVNFFRYGNSLYLTDLPGYGYARVPEAERRSWEQLVTSYLVDRAPLALCLFLVDVRHEPTDADRTLGKFLDQYGLPYALAATKADKLGRGELNRRVDALRNGLGLTAREVVPVSAETRDGTDRLWTVIRQAAAEHGADSSGGSRDKGDAIV
jgi:GTP-binding protein